MSKIGLDAGKCQIQNSPQIRDLEPSERIITESASREAYARAEDNSRAHRSIMKAPKSNDFAIVKICRSQRL